MTIIEFLPHRMVTVPWARSIETGDVFGNNGNRCSSNQIVPLAHWQLGQAYAEKGMYRDALAELETHKALTRGDATALAYLGNVLARSGEQKQALQVLEELRKVSQHKYAYSLGFARIYAGLGDKDHAFEWLEAGYRERSTPLFFLKVDPIWDPLRSDPRFNDLLRRIGLLP